LKHWIAKDRRWNRKDFSSRWSSETRKRRIRRWPRDERKSQHAWFIGPKVSNARRQKDSSWKCQSILLFTCGCCFCCWASARRASAHTVKQRRCRSQWRPRWHNANLATVWVWVRPGAFRLIWEDLVALWWKEIQPSIMNARSDRSQIDDAALDLDCANRIERESHALMSTGGVLQMQN